MVSLCLILSPVLEPETWSSPLPRNVAARGRRVVPAGTASCHVFPKRLSAAAGRWGRAPPIMGGACRSEEKTGFTRSSNLTFETENQLFEDRKEENKINDRYIYRPDNSSALWGPSLVELGEPPVIL